MSPWRCLIADVYRVYGRFRLLDVVRGFIAKRTLRPIVTMRLCQMAHTSGFRFVLLPLARLLHKAACQLACIDLPWNLKAGPGLAVTHGWGLVVSPGCVLGANVTLFHGATLGRRDRIDREGKRQTGYPVIEDEVWIGPHAIIVGGITIGRGSRIGGGVRDRGCPGPLHCRRKSGPDRKTRLCT